MHFTKSLLVVLAIAAGHAPLVVRAADAPAMDRSGSGAFVSYNGGLLTLKGKSGHLLFNNVGAKFKAYQNNEEGPGSRLVDTMQALSGAQLPGKIRSLTRVLPGTKMRVDVEKREIYFGYDFRVIGTLVSFEGGKLNLAAADVPEGFVKIPAGPVSLPIDPMTPVLESIHGGDLKFAGSAGEMLKKAKPGAVITTHSHYDPDVVEVVEIGEPKRRMERYIGETSGTVRGSFLSFKGDILRINGKGIGASLTDPYDQLIVRRVLPEVPILESVDGGPYEAAGFDALRRAKEGTVITIRKVEDLILEIRVGLSK